jgi:hypothetical protein
MNLAADRIRRELQGNTIHAPPHVPDHALLRRIGGSSYAAEWKQKLAEFDKGRSREASQGVDRGRRRNQRRNKVRHLNCLPGAFTGQTLKDNGREV